MPDYVTLLGTEEVRRAANTMKTAADQMSQAAASIDESNRRFLNRYEDLVVRMEQAAAKPDTRSLFEQVFGK